MKKIEMPFLPCTRCGLLPPDPDPYWTGGQSGTCPCHPSRAESRKLAKRARKQHEAAVLRAWGRSAQVGDAA